jgi:maleamate amidohydrolase
VITKTSPSVFFGTPLDAYLNALDVDSIIVCGTTTSGCIRATTVDGFARNLRVAVAEEACFDRGEVSHAIALFDLNAKYADVMRTDEIVDYIESLDDDLFAGMIAPHPDSHSRP